MGWKLLDKDGKEVEPGMIIQDFRGEKWQLLDIMTDGKLWVAGRGTGVAAPGNRRVFFPSVFRCTTVFEEKNG